MLVVGILAMLAVLVVPNLLNTGERAKRDVAKQLVGPSGTISSAINQFRMNHGKWPERLVDLIEKPDYLEDDSDWGPYLDKTQEFKDPWKHELIYKGGEDAQVNQDAFDLICVGPDGKEGNEDDITNFKKEK
jgi:type II secretion system protein G